MRTLRAVVFGVGAMNSVATRFMLEKGVQIVGASPYIALLLRRDRELGSE